ncbi:MAG: hypothetical protein ACJAYJ_003187 [Saprospiraceae bacterium]|jgi:hypothetical protein
MINVGDLNGFTASRSRYQYFNFQFTFNHWVYYGCCGYLSYGFASRDVFSSILGSFFSRRTFMFRQTIEIDGQRGKIVEMTNISMTIQINENERLVIPANQLITKQIKIIG